MSVRPVEIRPAREDDAEQVYRLAYQLDPAVDIDRQTFLGAFPELLKDEGHCCLVAASEDQVLGYAVGSRHLALYAEGTVARLDEMVVQNDLRHSGIGTRLVEAFEAWAVDRGCILADLATEAAGPFYESLGYGAKGTYYVKPLR